ncbi:MAG: hypothetical protein ACOX7P_08190 [Oscillospiraceae bacterium]|jgi:hypothetical protein
MKRHVKILALVLALAVTLVGAGYAAWGTAATVTTKLHTGEWKIVFENDATSSYWAADSIGQFSRNGDVLTGTIDDGDTDWGELDNNYNPAPGEPNGNVYGYPADFVYVMEPFPKIDDTIAGAAIQNCTDVIFQFYNLHPGTRAYTRFEIRNDGSIPAKIGDVKVYIRDKDGNPIDLNAQENLHIAQVYNEMVVNPKFALHVGTGGTTEITIPSCTLATLEAALDAELVGEVLLPDYTLYSYEANEHGSTELETGPDAERDLASSFNFELPASSLEGNKGMNAEFQVVIEFDFVQYNQTLGAAGSN